MKRTRLKPPYKEDGSTSFPARNLPGCYLIYKDGTWDRELRYVGHSATDVYKALYRHFQVWNDRQVDAGLRGERIVYKVRNRIKVRVIYCNTAAQARELEKALILKYRPVDNPDKLEYLEITPAGEEMVKDAFGADWVTDEQAPF